MKYKEIEVINNQFKHPIRQVVMILIVGCLIGVALSAVAFLIAKVSHFIGL